ncbi:hypothetical protein LTR56_021330 [Elasticomyces elasticus]|nr:hypothetical protein LTR56_021330 [Elasticomyces elasticus]KAK3631671.1 hypothetical protein LTR22_020961 [Elasticomyces elasticus]
MKRVCIIGAGPAGLVTAKTLLQTGQFAVKVYEKNARIGGIWALGEDTRDGFLAPQTPTNLSRFTVGFGDLDWNEVDLGSKLSDNTTNSNVKFGQVPTFPKAWQANRYLEEYRKRYIPDDVLSLSTEIVRASRCMKEQDTPLWQIEIKGDQGRGHVEEFDYLVVASGFFSAPQSPQQAVPATSVGKIQTMHSSQFRTLEGLFPGEQKPAGKSILLVGGGNSAGETAAAVAMQLSDAAWSLDTSRQKRYEGCRIVHVTPRPLYGLPPYQQYEKDSLTYVPIDFKLYDFSKRPQMNSYAGRQAPEIRDMVHGALQAMVGGDQSDLSEALSSPPNGEGRGTVYVTLSETYSEFVRSCLIEVKAGRVVAIDHETGSATAEHDDMRSSVETVGAVIYATGYTPSTALGFLADDIKDTLMYDPDSVRLPLILEQWQSMTKCLPDAAFIGFYEGPYWPMMEMQARLTAGYWTTGKDFAPQRQYESTQGLLELREAMQAKALDVPQYWFGDYIGYVEDIAVHLKLMSNDSPFKSWEGCPSPARYLSATTDEAQANAVMADLYKVWHACVDDGRFVARACLRAMHGDWNISRKIESEDPAFSGTLKGQASFHPRFPTKDRSGKAFDLEYLYVESGTFVSASGMTMTARRRYVYRYSESEDSLSVWFVKPDNDLEVDYLFHDLSFVTPAEARKARACVAKADHLCVDDMYWTKYTLPMEAIVLRNFEVQHKVRGPQKDYIATTQYSRPARLGPQP